MINYLIFAILFLILAIIYSVILKMLKAAAFYDELIKAHDRLFASFSCCHDHILKNYQDMETLEYISYILDKKDLKERFAAEMAIVDIDDEVLKFKEEFQEYYDLYLKSLDAYKKEVLKRPLIYKLLNYPEYDDYQNKEAQQRFIAF